MLNHKDNYKYWFVWTWHIIITEQQLRQIIKGVLKWKLLLVVYNYPHYGLSCFETHYLTLQNKLPEIMAEADSFWLWATCVCVQYVWMRHTTRLKDCMFEVLVWAALQRIKISTRSVCSQPNPTIKRIICNTIVMMPHMGMSRWKKWNQHRLHYLHGVFRCLWDTVATFIALKQLSIIMNKGHQKMFSIEKTWKH